MKYIVTLEQPHGDRSLDEIKNLVQGALNTLEIRDLAVTHVVDSGKLSVLLMDFETDFVANPSARAGMRRKNHLKLLKQIAGE